MTNPYSWLSSNPDLALWYAAVGLILVVWVFLSVRGMFRWYVTIRENMGSGRGDLFPDWKTSKEIALLVVTLAVNLALLGLFVHLTAV